jgi:molybdopterin synthase sulfur carrier subunit
VAKLLYFAALADRLGRTSEDVTLPPQVGDVRALLAWLRSRGGPWEQWLADSAVRVAVNRQLTALDAPVDDRSEIAILSTTLR